MPSLYRCRKVVVLKTEDEILTEPPEHIVNVAIDLDEVEEIAETLEPDGPIFEDRCSVHFKSGNDNIIAVVTFETLFKAWQEACNTAVLLRRFG